MSAHSLTLPLQRPVDSQGHGDGGVRRRVASSSLDLGTGATAGKDTEVQTRQVQ